MTKALAFLFFFIPFSNVGSPQNSILKFRNAKDLLTLKRHAWILEDASERLTLDEVLKDSLIFHLLDKEQFAHLPTGSVFWFKVDCKNYTDEDIWLEIGSINVWIIDFYSPDLSGKYGKPIKTGSLRPEGNKLVDVNLFWLPLNRVGERETKTYYFRVQAKGPPVEIPILVGTLTTLYKNKTVNDYFTGAFIGLMVIMFFYNAVLLFSTKDKLYSYYLGYILLWIVICPYANGHPWMVYFTDDLDISNWIHKKAPVWISPLYIFMYFYSTRYLNLKKNAPGINRIMKGEVWVLSFIIPVAMLLGAPLLSLMNLFQTFILIFYLTCLLAGYFLSFKGEKYARFYSVAWTLMILSNIVYFLSINGVIPYNNITRNSLYWGIGVEAWLFSLALADRLNIMKKEKEEAQSQLVLELKINEDLISKRNEELEQKVKEKTKELQCSNDEIKEVNDELNQALLNIENNLRLVMIQKSEIEAQREEIARQSNIICQANVKLEDKVRERTCQLLEEHDKLKLYAFKNSHEIRAPLASLLGLLNLIELDRSGQYNDQYLNLVRKAAESLDARIRDLNKILEHTELIDES